MSFLFDAGGLVGAISGVALGGLGIAVFALRPRTRASVSFALAAILWGGAVAAFGVGLLTDDPRRALVWARAGALLYIPLYVPLVYFAISYPWSSTPLARSAGMRALVALPAVVLLALFLLHPEWYVASSALGTDGLPRTRFGPLYAPVVNASSVLAFAVTLALVLRKLSMARTDAERSQLGLVGAGFLFYVSYRAAAFVPTALVEPGRLWASLGPKDYSIRLSLCVAALAVTLMAGALAWRTRSLPWRRLFVVAATVPFAFGVLEALGAIPGSFQTFGVWRLATVATLAYGIARWRVFGLDLRMKWTLSRGTVAAAFVAVFFALSEGAQVVLQNRTNSTLIAIAGAALLVFALAPLHRFAERFADAAFPGVRPSSDYFVYRKMQIYRAAFEGALSGGVSAKERSMLLRLQQELGVGAEDAAALEREVLRSLSSGS